MEPTGTTLVLMLAFGLGMLHALDADHVMVVSGLSSSDSGSGSRLRGSLGFCLRWALGHGLVLLVIAAAVYLLGYSIPHSLSEVAESLVGAVLIVIGVMVIRDLFKQHAHLHFHKHGNIPAHAHWHVHEDLHDRCSDHHADKSHQHNHNHNHNHSAILVGMLHGMAGSAPLLALIPVAQQHSPVLGMFYVLLFSLGVLLSMLLFGGVLGTVFAWLERIGNQVVYTLRAIVAIAAIAFGGVLLQSSFV